MSTSHPITALKIYRKTEWESYQSTGSFAGSPDDKRDGFIHLSFADQAAESAVRYFKDVHEIVIANYTFPVEDKAIKLEESRGGALFPHYYGTLSQSHETAFMVIKRDENSAWDKSAIQNAIDTLGTKKA